MLKNVLLFNKFYHSIYWHKHCIIQDEMKLWCTFKLGMKQRSTDLLLSRDFFAKEGCL